MKLSEAIRKGIELDGPQCFGNYFEFTPEGKIASCCALGAAALGAGLTEEQIIEAQKELRLGHVVFIFLEENVENFDLERDFIVYLNDKVYRTREEIAYALEEKDM